VIWVEGGISFGKGENKTPSICLKTCISGSQGAKLPVLVYWKNNLECSIKRYIFAKKSRL
jgi:hypothetical protein